MKKQNAVAKKTVSRPIETVGAKGARKGEVTTSRKLKNMEADELEGIARKRTSTTKKDKRKVLSRAATSQINKSKPTTEEVYLGLINLYRSEEDDSNRFLSYMSSLKKR